MAAPPRQRQWNVEPPADAAWFSDGLLELNSFISSVTYAMTKQLTRADNFRSMLKSFDIDTTNPTFPLDFDCTLGGTPTEIRVAQVTKNAPTGAVTVAYWELLEGAKIRVHNITGLAANTKYTITLIVE